MRSISLYSLYFSFSRSLDGRGRYGGVEVLKEQVCLCGGMEAGGMFGWRYVWLEVSLGGGVGAGGMYGCWYGRSRYGEVGVGRSTEVGGMEGRDMGV